MTSVETPLITPEDRAKLDANLQEIIDWCMEHNTWNTTGLYPVVKLSITALSVLWILCHSDDENPNRFYGLYDNGIQQPKSDWLDIAAIRTHCQTLGYTIERDARFDPQFPFEIYEDAARVAKRIVEDEASLRAAYQANWFYGGWREPNL